MTEEPRSPQEGRMKFEIKSIITGGIIFNLDTSSIRLCIEVAVRNVADQLPVPIIRRENGQTTPLP